MSSDDLEYPEINDNENELVPAVFARDSEEAERYCELLSDHGIIGVVASDVIEPEVRDDESDDDEETLDVEQGAGMTSGVAVLVEECLLDEASLVIADREDLAEFQFDDEEDDEEEEDELEFAQGLDSDFEDDAPAAGAGILPQELDDLADFDVDLGEDDEADDDKFGDEFDLDFDED